MQVKNYYFTLVQQKKALFWLSIFHIVVIASSNYLVQFPFNIGAIHSTWGAFTFPFIFLATDLTVRIFGSSLARRIIFCVMFPALFLSYGVSVLFQDGTWLGWSELSRFNVFVVRIALASFTAYVIGQIMDIYVFNRLRQLKSWWIAPSASTLVGNALDTLIFFSIAFYMSSDAFMAQHWMEIALVDYAVKLAIGALFFLPAYGILLSYLTKKLITYQHEAA